MTTEPSGKLSIEQVRATLPYWIRERESIRMRKSEGLPKPWSDDPIFQTTYFTNVHREHDRVTQWIRNFYNPWVGHQYFELNMVLARFLNWPPTLSLIGYVQIFSPRQLEDLLNFRAETEKVWGGAYVITTHGIPMPKTTYLCQNVLPSVLRNLESVQSATTCAGAAKALQGIEGVGSFLAGQVVADLKNTPGHKLYNAEDKFEFAVHGPGSLRGLSWMAYGSPDGIGPSRFQEELARCRNFLWVTGFEEIEKIDNQDLQNCLCEFDKYMRIKTGTGRSKRNYDGK